MQRLNRDAAVAYLHQRHPRVIDAPEGPVSSEILNLELFWFQNHVCELIEARAERRLRPCFETMESLLHGGDREVLNAVHGHFFLPRLGGHAGLAWARTLMPRLLGEVCDIVLAGLEAENRDGPRGVDGSGER